MQRGAKDGGVNVQVILRCRPYSKQELNSRSEAHRQFVQCAEANREVTIFPSAGGGKQLERSFHFDKVFGPDSGQERLYNQAVAPIVEEVLEGFNCTIFAYGQTGTGKTYTMEGGNRDSADGNNLSEVAGVIPRAIHHIFTTLDGNDSEYTVKCSFLELYNEETTDLLAVGDRQDQKLRILEDRNGVVIQGLEEFIVKNSVDIYALLDRGSAKRKTAETQLNKQSSRSHSVFCVTVHMREIAADGEEVIKIGKLYLVDLAGSENVSRSGAAGTMAKEAGSINKSLLTLGRVITALVEGSGHIPYRDSKLTRLLRDSLGGRTKTCIIATIAPTAHCQDETLSTLDYAHRAKNIRNRPEVNQKISKTAHIKELNAEIDRLKAELFATREKNGVYLPVDQFEQREEVSKSNVQRLEALEEEMEAVAAKHKANTDRLSAEIDRTRQELSDTFAALEQARLGLQERDFLIATHARSENAIAAHATNLAADLQAATTEMALLYSRLDETVAREMGNVAVVAELREASDAKLAAMQTAVSAALSEAQQGLRGVSAQLDTFVSRKDENMSELQARLAVIQGQLDTVAVTATTATDAVREAALQSLRSVQSSHAAYTQTSKEAAVQAENASSVLFRSLIDSQATHKTQLEAFSEAERETSATLLKAVQGAACQGREGLLTMSGAAKACTEGAQVAFSQQKDELAIFKDQFTDRIAEDQAQLMRKISEMLSAFADSQAKEVGQAVEIMSSRLAVGEGALAERSQQVCTVLEEAQQLVKAEAADATAFAEKAEERRGQHEAALQTSLDQSSMHGNMLQLQIQHSATNAASQLESHSASLDTLVSEAASALAAASLDSKEQCTAAVASTQETYKAVQATSLSQHAADKADVGRVAQTADGTNTSLADFGSRHQDNITQLATEVQSYTGDKYTQDPRSGELPPKQQIEVPPQSWLDEMRTPARDVLLAEFRRQRDGIEAEATGALAPAASDNPATAEPSPAPGVSVGDKEMAEADGDEKENQDGGGHPNLTADAAVVLKSRIPVVKGRTALGAADSDSRGAGPDQGGKRKRLKA